MASKKGKDGGDIVCEFFGIEIKTKNPRVAKVLTSDVSEILNTEITVIKGKWSEDESGEAKVEPGKVEPGSASEAEAEES